MKDQIYGPNNNFSAKHYTLLMEISGLEGKV